MTILKISTSNFIRNDYWYLVVLYEFLNHFGIVEKNWHVKNHTWRLQKGKKITWGIKKDSYNDKFCVKVPKAKFNSPRI